MGGGIRIGDSNWFLYLVDRVAHGDSLYLDRFYGVTPLAVWAGLPGVLLIGAQAAVVKGLTRSGLRELRNPRGLHGPASRSRPGRAGPGAACQRRVHVLPTTPYKPMAAAAQVGAMAAMAAWLAAGSERSRCSFSSPAPPSASRSPASRRSGP